MEQKPLFASRFLDNYAGSLVRDPITALIELVANSWDAGATVVRIRWPDESKGIPFSISDDGIGMTKPQFEKRWRTLDYDRRDELPSTIEVNGRKRPVFGRNGRGRHAAFLFGTPYMVTTRSSGNEVTYRVSRGVTTPLLVDLVDGPNVSIAKGTEIRSEKATVIKLDANTAKQEIGARFLHDPDFNVFVNDELVEFGDLPSDCLSRETIDVPEIGPIELLVIDTQRSDKTSQQHGVSWRVQDRLVGDISWRGLETVDIDRRTANAKRYSFIVLAPETLAPAIHANWGDGFISGHPLWNAARKAVEPRIVAALDSQDHDRRREARAEAVERNTAALERMPHAARARWGEFVDRVVTDVKSITDAQVVQLATILANLEASRSRFGLIEHLSKLDPKRLDELHEVLEKWSVDMAREVLDEIESRLQFIAELQRRMDDPSTQEVQELQPLFERGLWLFGVEYESIEFTSNRGMTTVIQKLLRHPDEKGSLLRPDFAIRPDGTVGLYSCPSYDGEANVAGVGKLVIVELKKPGLRIGEAQKAEVWGYVKDLRAKGHLTDGTIVQGYVLGSEIDPLETGDRTEPNVRITPMLFQTALVRAQKRMMNLFARVKDAPMFKKAVESPSIASTGPTQTEMAVGD